MSLGSINEFGAFGERLVALEDTYVSSTRFEAVSGATGTVTLPPSSTVILDSFGDALDAIVSQIDAGSGKPTFVEAVDSSSVPITTTFGADGRFISAAVPVPPNADSHFKEIGHVIESKSAGTNVLAKCVLHFN